MRKRYDDETVQSYYEQAENLATIVKPFCDAVMVEKVADERTAFNVVMTIADTYFLVQKDYKGYITVSLYKHEQYNKVSSHARGEVYKKYTTNNMKVLNAKKMIEKVNACTRGRDELRKLQSQAIETQRMFICDIEALKMPVQYQYNSEYVTNEKTGAYERVNTDIKGGTIVKNGIEYTFEFCDDAYISQKTRLHYSVGNTIADFIALSKNEYKAK